MYYAWDSSSSYNLSLFHAVDFNSFGWNGDVSIGYHPNQNVPVCTANKIGQHIECNAGHNIHKSNILCSDNFLSSSILYADVISVAG